MSKSARTQRRYQKAFRGQRKLTSFGFMAPQYDPHLQPLTLLQGSRKCSLQCFQIPLQIVIFIQRVKLCMMLQDMGAIDEGLSENRSEIQLDLDPVNVDPAGHNAEVEDWEAEVEEVVEGPLDAQDVGVIDEGVRSESENRRGIQLDLDQVNVDSAYHDEEIEDWEAELEEVIEGPKGHIRDWEALRTDIKKHLKKHSKTLPLSQLNQFLIICNFATL